MNGTKCKIFFYPLIRSLFKETIHEIEEYGLLTNEENNPERVPADESLGAMVFSKDNYDDEYHFLWNFRQTCKTVWWENESALHRLMSTKRS